MWAVLLCLYPPTLDNQSNITTDWCIQGPVRSRTNHHMAARAFILACNDTLIILSINFFSISIVSMSLMQKGPSVRRGLVEREEELGFLH